MPSMFEALKRIVQGKPVFDTEGGSAEVGDSFLAPVHTSGEPVIQKGKDSTFPVVEVKRVHTSHNGPNIQIHCSIKNTWSGEVEVDKIRVLEKTHEIDITLRPGQEREVLVYSGPALTRQQGSEALLSYKTTTGDYFEAAHEVRYNYNSDKTYEVSELRLRRPVRDIFG